MTYDAIFRGRDKSQRNKSRFHSHSNGTTCKYCGRSHNRGNCPAFGKKCQKCGRENHFKAVCKSGNENCKPSHSRPKKGKGKGKRFHEVTEDQNSSAMDNLADQVQSLFYHDIHFNAINTWMHTRLECEAPHGLKTNEIFKIDTGVDGNLMLITMFVRLFPKISPETLEKTVERGVTLLAYNNTPIKQFVTCSVRISFKGKQIICKFYVVEFNTAIIGISDSETLGLVNINFDVIEKGNLIKVVHNIESDCFKRQIKTEFPDLFKGIGCMEGEISIKLHDGTIPHTEPIRCVPHAMQQLLKDELDKLVKEVILHKVDISEPIEWLNSFFCVKKPNGKIRLCLDPTHLNK